MLLCDLKKFTWSGDVAAVPHSSCCCLVSVLSILPLIPTEFWEFLEFTEINYLVQGPTNTINISYINIINYYIQHENKSRGPMTVYPRTQDTYAS